MERPTADNLEQRFNDLVAEYDGNDFEAYADLTQQIANEYRYQPDMIGYLILQLTDIYEEVIQ